MFWRQVKVSGKTWAGIRGNNAVVFTHNAKVKGELFSRPPFHVGKQSVVLLADPVIGINVLSDAASMVSEDGLVRVRLSADSNQGGCLYVELGLEGRR